MLTNINLKILKNHIKYFEQIELLFKKINVLIDKTFFITSFVVHYCSCESSKRSSVWVSSSLLHRLHILHTQGNIIVIEFKTIYNLFLQESYINKCSPEILKGKIIMLTQNDRIWTVQKYMSLKLFSRYLRK